MQFNLTFYNRVERERERDDSDIQDIESFKCVECHF